jgi:hypothetical protein
MTTLNRSISLHCNKGEHGKCNGQPPSAQMARFLPADMRDSKCACSCHKLVVTATDRDESEACECGTPGCSVDHSRSHDDAQCEGW